MSGKTITFAGHSLGGGVASLMTGLFGHESTTFAMAPFERALNADNVNRLANHLTGLGYTEQAAQLQSLLYYEQTESGPELRLASQIIANRQSLVTHYAVTGEALGSLRTFYNTYAGTEHPIDVGGTQASSIDRHSISLHLAAQGSESFREASEDLPSLLKYVFDPELYSRVVNKNRKNSSALSSTISSPMTRPATRSRHTCSTASATTCKSSPSPTASRRRSGCRMP